MIVTLSSGVVACLTGTAWRNAMPRPPTWGAKEASDFPGSEKTTAVCVVVFAYERIRETVEYDQLRGNDQSARQLKIAPA